MAFQKVTPEEISQYLIPNDEHFDLSADRIVMHPRFKDASLTCSCPRLLPLDKDGCPFIPGYSLVGRLDKEHQICQELDGGTGVEFIHVYTGRYDGVSDFGFTAPDKATHLFLTEQHNNRPPLHKGIDSAFGKAHGAVWYHHENGDSEDDSAMSFWILSEIPSCLTDYLQDLGEAERQC